MQPALFESLLYHQIIQENAGILWVSAGSIEVSLNEVYRVQTCGSYIIVTKVIEW